MIRRPALYLILFLASVHAFGQTEAQCVQTLRIAQSTYESGRLHELPDMLKDCLNSGFTKDERRQAYKLLVQSYIYLEEPEKADEAMLNLLRTDHFFKPNEEVDPAEFVSLYERFRTKSIFRIGARFGPAINAPLTLLDYSAGSGADGTGEFTPLVSFFGGLVWEKDFFDARLTIAPELVYSVRSYRENSDVFVQDENPNSTASNLEDLPKLSMIELNPLAKWWLSKNPKSRDGKIEPYVIGGPGVNFLIKGSLEDPKLDHVSSGAGTNTGPAIDITDIYRTVNLSAVLGVGFRWRLGEIYVIPDVRFHYGLTNIVDPKTRSNMEALFDYTWIANDTKLTSLTINVGIQWAYFSPKKLIK